MDKKQRYLSLIYVLFGVTAGGWELVTTGGEGLTLVPGLLFILIGLSLGWRDPRSLILSFALSIFLILFAAGSFLGTYVYFCRVLGGPCILGQPAIKLAILSGINLLGLVYIFNLLLKRKTLLQNSSQTIDN